MTKRKAAQKKPAAPARAKAAPPPKPEPEPKARVEVERHGKRVTAVVRGLEPIVQIAAAAKVAFDEVEVALKKEKGRLLKYARDIRAEAPSREDRPDTLRFVAASGQTVSVEYVDKRTKLDPKVVEHCRAALPPEVADQLLVEETTLEVSGSLAQWMLKEHPELVGRDDFEPKKAMKLAENFSHLVAALAPQIPEGSRRFVDELEEEGHVSPSVKFSR